MPFPGSFEWGFELLAERLGVLQPLPQDAFCTQRGDDGARPRRTGSVRLGRGKGRREVTERGHGAAPWGSRGEKSLGLRLLSSPGWRGAGAGGACALDCITNFLLFTVVGRAISMLTLFLFNLAFAAAAACS